jgi:hypothetical protein
MNRRAAAAATRINRQIMSAILSFSPDRVRDFGAVDLKGGEISAD